MSSIDGVGGASFSQGQTTDTSNQAQKESSEGKGFRSTLASAAGGTVSTAAKVTGSGTLGVVADGIRGLRGGSSSSSSGGMPNAQDEQLERMFEMQKQSQAFNLQYLELQNGLQEDNRQFSTLTNLMKVRHDTAKAAINNMHA